VKVGRNNLIKIAVNHSIVKTLMYLMPRRPMSCSSRNEHNQRRLSPSFSQT
jgi:hypothetical protein